MRIVILFLLFAMPLFGDEIDFSELIAPPLPLTQQPLIAIDPEYHQEHLHNKTHKFVSHNAETIAEKVIPWHFIIAAAAVAVVILLIKASPSRVSDYDIAIVSPAQMQAAAVKELNEVIGKGLPQQNLYDEYYAHLDHAVRTFLNGKYNINAPTSTSQELMEKIKDLSTFEKEKVSTLLRFLQESDRVKFAHYRPTVEEYTAAVEEAKSLLR